MNKFRTPVGGRIDRGTPLTFTFNGKTYHGYQGDTLASALLANGEHLVGRSFKYHRPRGVMTAGSEEPNALVGLTRGGAREEPNNRATVAELYEGMCATSQNHWPSLSFDIGAINDRLGMLFTAGFYYKTFMWPKTFWNKVYEPIIRSAAGLGKSPTQPDPDHYASRYEHCDVLIVGAGATGISAALSAGRSGAHVILVDEQAEAGGSLLSEASATIDGKTATAWLESAIASLKAMPNVTLLTRTTAIGYYHYNMLGLCQRVTDHLTAPPADAPRERLWRVRAKQVVLAQGAIEKPLVFPDNDRPGIMLAGAARTYLNRYGVIVGRRVVVATSHDSAWGAAFDLANSGGRIAMIVDLRKSVSPELVANAQALGIETLLGWTVSGTAGRKRISKVRVNPLTSGGGVGAGRSVNCDALLTSGGWTPSVHLFSHTKGELTWNETLECFLPGKSLEALQCPGAGAGDFGLVNALNAGRSAGEAAAKTVGRQVADAIDRYVVDGEITFSGVSQRDLPGEGNPDTTKAFVDQQNDVTAKDIRLAVREGFRSIEHIKRYTTNGMATDQGKTSNINGLAIAAEALGKTPPSVGLTTFRPPYTPTTFGAFAGYRRGDHFEVTRKTPMDSAAVEAGAIFEPVGLWRRALYFPRSGETMHEAVARECRTVREKVGIFDASTLGKIEVVGPDAAEFLNRIYINSWTKLAPGRCRYGLLLGEDGYIRDDGVIGRIAQDRFHVTTTTGGAARVFGMMEDYRQTEWPDLDVWLTSTTEQWAVMALNGPNARKVIEPLVDGIDLSPNAFPHMSVAEGRICGVPLRLFRVSFSGELGFEVNVPSRYGLAIWRALMESGKGLGISPYGTEAMHILRAEKGYIIVGQDTDGTVTPQDAGYGRMVATSKPDFVGKRGLVRPDLVANGRRQVVGLLTTDPHAVLEEGAQLVANPARKIPMKMIGHVTSSYHSTTLGRSIALALLENGNELIGKKVYVPMPGRTEVAEVTSTEFYDPEGKRLEM
ncbi:sarcosine oxidase subunit alpha [Ensifer sp. BR816]|uniref:sarcosine oxidase subunit alpha n=1 Tax=Rhizobium sp. (strain BR816) TaxID=1057002 RepID=UPI000360F04A|nr:sarcosine oxidase subunit alpha [Ensifer sp. BR816]